MAIFFRNIFKYVHAMSLINVDIIVITLLVIHLLLLAGDIEFNPGPGGTPDLIERVLPIYHGNIRHIRENISETKLDKNTVLRLIPLDLQ
jgi:hypothetical protein